MYLIVMIDEDDVWMKAELDDFDLQACDDCLIDIFKIEKDDVICRLNGGEWDPVKLEGAE